EVLGRSRAALALKRTIDEAVGELRSTSEYLAQHGRQQREVAILALDWRPRDPALPAEAAAFLARRHRGRAEDRIRALGGTPSEAGTAVLVAVFDAPEPRTRSLAAGEGALAVLARVSAGEAGGGA